MSKSINNSFDVKYAPKTLQEVVIADLATEVELQRYVSGETRNPIILYGPYGTGKTTLAMLMPGALSGRTLIEPVKHHPDVLFLNPADGLTQKQRLEQIQVRLRYTPAALRMRFFIFDELDLLGREVISCVKSYLDRGQEQAIFIATTNSLSALEGGHKSRSTRLHIVPAPLHRWKPRIEHILDAEGVPVPEDEVLEDMLKLSKGDHRQFLSELQRYTEDVQQVAAE